MENHIGDDFRSKAMAASEAAIETLGGVGNLSGAVTTVQNAPAGVQKRAEALRDIVRAVAKQLLRDDCQDAEAAPSFRSFMAVWNIYKTCCIHLAGGTGTASPWRGEAEATGGANIQEILTAFRHDLQKLIIDCESEQYITVGVAGPILLHLLLSSVSSLEVVVVSLGVPARGGPRG